MANEKTVWLSWQALLKKQFEKALAADAAGTVYTDEFFKGLKDRHEKLEARNLKLMLFNNALFFSLFLAILHKTVEFSAAGISSSDLYEIKELILFISATVGFITALNAIYSAELEVLQKVYLTKKFGEVNLSFWQRCVPGWLAMPLAPDTWQAQFLLRRKVTLILHFAHLFLFLAVLIAIVILSIGIHIYMIIETIKDPTLPTTLFYLAIGYVIACDVTAICWLTLFYLPLPHTDHGPLVKALAQAGIDPNQFGKKA